jgi:hypothetical protein
MENGILSKHGPYHKTQCNIILHKDALSEMIEQLSPIIGNITVSDSKTDYMKYIRWSSQDACDKFADYRYSQPGPYLERKKEQFWYKVPLTSNS